METFLTAEQDFIKRAPIASPLNRPQTLSEVDLPLGFLEDLALKTLYLSGSITVLDLSTRLHLCYEVANELFFRMRSEVHCQVTGMTGNIPILAITSQGRQRAMELLGQSHYTGACPITLNSYVEQTRKQSVKKVTIRPNDVARGFAHLVVDQSTLDKFGTALNSGSSIFLYGPAGVGKTTMAEALSRVLAEDKVWLPYGIEVDGQVITIYDPAIHHRVADEEPDFHDDRWVLCERPNVLVGGELTAEMLDLDFNPITKFYVGPIQLKANNGVLIIDDFGRQRLRPEELLNRWVVPLDRRIDFLTLAGGKKIEVPFEMLVVFASNMDPAELGDAAFLRRIQTKVKLGEVTDDQFREIMQRVTRDNGVDVDPAAVSFLINYIHGTLRQELRSCYPRDVVNQVIWSARYEGKKPFLDLASVNRAIDAYFLKPVNVPLAHS
jgi:predicted ATPase with chaperone activity